MMGLQITNAQKPQHIKFKYNCWIYPDAKNDMNTNRMGVIYSVADSGINFSPVVYGKIAFEKDSSMLQYIPATKIDYINVRRKGSVGKGALIGLGVSGVLGIAIVYAAVKTSDHSGWTVHSNQNSGTDPAVFFGGVALVGAGLGALIASQKIEISINKKQNKYHRQKEEIRKYSIAQ